MPNFKSISLKMAVLQWGGQNLPPPPHVCVIQKTPCGIGLTTCDTYGDRTWPIAGSYHSVLVEKL